MPKPLSVIFIGACLLVCESAQNSNSKKVLLSKDYGVKLCGREFIRAVIFTCGGSRWKRAMNLDLLLRSDNGRLRFYHSCFVKLIGLSLASGTYPIQLSSLIVASEKAGMFNRPPSTDLMRIAEQTMPPFSVSLFSSLADFLKLFDDQKQTGAESNEQQLSYKLHFDRKKRNFSHGLAGICCNQGCTKNDIGRLC
ncbi:prorelaxin H1 [Alosa pseudoharengus]|uniref:prorelaxin H1 n=1 Tax=Alosa pseudoharengus TaxID=34774 RepID=UPI003F8C901B